ncbi:MAG: AraC family transcriptional regulator, partial [Gammaproteobacteria bacterium]|nr:AraC family transcriptional regulator [Gammaproteobacteria bacterium]
MDLGGPAQVLCNPQILGGSRVHFISPEPNITSAQGLCLTALEPLPAEIKEHSWVLIIGSYQSKEVYQQAAGQTATLWLQQQDWHKLTLGCICSGALLAAKAGLLAERRCTTHHHLIEQLKVLTPTSRVLENRLFIGDGNIWTSAGISTGIDLCLHLISLYWDHQTANQIARELVLHHRRHGDDPQLSIWLQHRNHMH